MDTRVDARKLHNNLIVEVKIKKFYNDNIWLSQTFTFLYDWNIRNNNININKSEKMMIFKYLFDKTRIYQINLDLAKKHGLTKAFMYVRINTLIN